jgi:hypothetical protein
VACGAINSLCGEHNSAAEEALGAAGACAALVQSMGTLPYEADLQLNALAAMARLARDSGANRMRLGEAGACAAVCVALAAAAGGEEEGAEEKSAEACRVVEVLACGCVVNQRALGEAGALEVLCDVVGRFAEGPALADSATRAFQAVLGAAQEEGADGAGAHDAATLVAALRVCVQRRELAVPVLRALVRVGEGSSGEGWTAEAEAAVGEAMRAHADDAELQR